MELAHAQAVELTMPSVSPASGRRPKTKCIPRGQNLPFGIVHYLDRFIVANHFSPPRYVELLLHQQDCLVHGLQELYRRATTGGSCLDNLKAGTNEHSFTHDLLSRLGALDCSKGERFEENPETMQQKLWIPAAGLQREFSSDDSIHCPDSSVMGDHRFVDATSQHSTPAFPAPGLAMMSESTVEIEQQAAYNLQVTPQMSLQSGVVNPLSLQGCPLQWNRSPFNPFDDTNYISTADCAKYGLEDSMPWSNCQLRLDCTNLTPN